MREVGGVVILCEGSRWCSHTLREVGGVVILCEGSRWCSRSLCGK